MSSTDAAFEMSCLLARMSSVAPDNRLIRVSVPTSERGNRETTNLFEQQRVKFAPAVFETRMVCRIDDPDDGVCRFEIVSPVGAQAFLTANVPFEQHSVSIGDQASGDGKERVKTDRR